MSSLGKQAVACHLGITAAFVAINLSPLMNSWSVSSLFELNAEGNVTVWFSSASLLAIAGLAARLAYRARTSERVGWSAIAGFFVLLSIDETASLHELAGTLFSERVAQLEWLPGLYAWVVVVAPPALAVALTMLWWMRRHIPAHNAARWLAPAALATWLLVPIAEFLDPVLGMPRALVVTEEALELIGIALMLGALVELSGFPQRASGSDPVPDRVLDRVAEPV